MRLNLSNNVDLGDSKLVKLLQNISSNQTAPSLLYSSPIFITIFYLILFYLHIYLFANFSLFFLLSLFFYFTLDVQWMDVSNTDISDIALLEIPNLCPYLETLNLTGKTMRLE